MLHCEKGHAVDRDWVISQTGCPVDFEDLLCPSGGCGAEIHGGAPADCGACTESRRRAEVERNYATPPSSAVDAPELGMVYAFDEMKPAWLRFMGSYARRIAVPTQVVAREAQFVVPRYGRVFETEFCRRGDRVYRLDELCRHERGFRGSYTENLVMMHECWVQAGVDGHVDYKFVGFVFVDQETYDRGVLACGRGPAEAHWFVMQDLPRCGERRGG